MHALGGKDLYLKVYGDKDAEVAAGPEVAKIFKAAADAREMAEGSNVQDWNQATNMVITDTGRRPDHGRLGAGRVPGRGRGRRQGLHLPARASASTRSSRPTATPSTSRCSRTRRSPTAQEVLASTMLNPETQVAFNLKKGSLPIRSDVDLAAANDCMKKGLAILAKGNTVASTDQLISPDTNTQIEDLMTEFFSDMSITPEDAQARFAEIIANAD